MSIKIDLKIDGEDLRCYPIPRIAQYRTVECLLKIARRKFADWDEQTKRRLNYATLPGGYLKYFTLAFPGSPTIVAFSEKQVVGWAFAFREKVGATNLFLFVNKRYRTHGIATALINAALENLPTIALAHWNEETERFFNKLHEEYPAGIIVYDWWKNLEKYTKILEAALLH